MDADLERKIRDEFNRERGRLAGLIESWGMPERQERGMIQTMKSMSYDAENNVVRLVRTLSTVQ